MSGERERSRSPLFLGDADCDLLSFSCDSERSRECDLSLDFERDLERESRLFDRDRDRESCFGERDRDRDLDLD